jgi:hypothetical protein
MFLGYACLYLYQKTSLYFIIGFSVNKHRINISLNRSDLKINKSLKLIGNVETNEVIEIDDKCHVATNLNILCAVALKRCMRSS